MHGKTIVLILVLFLAAAFSDAVGAGEIYRCTTATGEVLYTNIACPTNSQVQHIASYVHEQALPAPAVDPFAAQAAAISARLAQEAAEQARAAAYQSAQAARRDAEADAESERASDYDNYPLWVAPYPYFASRQSGHDGHHHHNVGRSGVVKSGSSVQPHRPVPPVNANLLARHR
jgi:hypothetical protein